MKTPVFLLFIIILIGCVKESEQIIIDAQEKAEQIINDAQKQAEQFQVTKNKNLHKIFKGLRRYQNGKNDVNKYYISSFEITSGKIKYTFHNSGTTPSKPNFKIHFVNTYGFITGEDNVVWLFDKVSQGETRIYERPINIRFGTPIYYFIDFD